MIQQVNLYQQGDKRPGHALLNPYLLCIVGICLSLLVVGGFSRHDLQTRQTELQQLQLQMKQAQARLQDLQARYPNQQTDNLLNSEIQQNQNLHHSLTRVLALLAEDHSDQTRGFSGYLSALASQADSGVWLTGIEFDSVTDKISLQGSTFKPEQIALLLQRLQHSGPFKGRYFAKLNIQQSEDASDRVDFSVSSRSKDDPKAADADKH